MFCRHCGKQIPDGSVFCRYCGKNLISDEETDCIGSKYNNYNEDTRQNKQPVQNNKNITKNKNVTKKSGKSNGSNKRPKNVTKTVYKNGGKKRGGIIQTILLLLIIIILLVGMAVAGYIWYTQYYIPSQDTTDMINDVKNSISNETANQVEKGISTAVNAVKEEVSKATENNISGTYKGYIEENGEQKNASYIITQASNTVVFTKAGGSTTSGIYDDKTGQMQATLDENVYDITFTKTDNAITADGTITLKDGTTNTLHLEKQ